MSLLGQILPAVAGFLTFFGILLLVLGLGSLGRRDTISRRLDAVTARAISLEDLEMQASFRDRFLRPLATNIARVLGRLTPSGVLEGTQKRLLHAGLAGRMQASDFMGMKVLGALVGLGLAVLYALLTGRGVLLTFVLLVVCGGLGYYFPDLWLRDRANERKREIQNALPDTIDLLTISVEAGLGFDQALQRIVAKSDNTLTREFGRVLQEMRVGVARRDALRALVERTGVDDLGTFVSSIIQAEQLGASIGRVLRIQAAEMRVRRRQRAETLAHQAPIKMLFPMTFLIMPPIFVVVLGPAIPKIVHAFAPGILL